MDTKTKDTINSWWESLENNRGGRAELRRCKQVSDVVLCPAFHRLMAYLPTESPNQVAPIAGLASHVQDIDSTRRFAEQMASGDKPAVSPVRFRKIITIDQRDKLYRPLVRVIQMLGKKVNLMDMAEGIYYWGKDRQKQWASEYYQNPNVLSQL